MLIPAHRGRCARWGSTSHTHKRKACDLLHLQGKAVKSYKMNQRQGCTLIAKWNHASVMHVQKGMSHLHPSSRFRPHQLMHAHSLLRCVEYCVKYSEALQWVLMTG